LVTKEDYRRALAHLRSAKEHVLAWVPSTYLEEDESVPRLVARLIDKAIVTVEIEEDNYPETLGIDAIEWNNIQLREFDSAEAMLDVCNTFERWLKGQLASSEDEVDKALRNLIRSGRNGIQYIQLVEISVSAFEQEYQKLTRVNDLQALRMLRGHLAKMADALQRRTATVTSLKKEVAHLRQIIALLKQETEQLRGARGTQASIRSMVVDGFYKGLGGAAAGAAASLGYDICLSIPSIVGYVQAMGGAAAGSQAQQSLLDYAGNAIPPGITA
jgi:hypothetical protein